MNKFLMLVMITGLIGCGYEKAEHVEYKKPEAAISKSENLDNSVSTRNSSTQKQGETDVSVNAMTCEEKALGLFKDQIQSAITQVCASCHSSGGQGSASIQFSAGEISTNIAVFRDYIAGDSEKLVAKLGPTGGHGGGVQIGNGITADGIRSWFAADSECL